MLYRESKKKSLGPSHCVVPVYVVEPPQNWTVLSVAERMTPTIPASSVRDLLKVPFRDPTGRLVRDRTNQVIKLGHFEPGRL